MKIRSLKKPDSLVVHPILMWTFPVVSLFAHNIGQVYFNSLWRPLALAVVFSLLVWLVSSFLVKNAERAAVLTTYTAALFFAYGYTRIAGWLFFERALSPIVLAAIWFIALIGVGWMIAAHLKHIQFANQLLNWIAVGVLIIPVGQIVIHQGIELRQNWAENQSSGYDIPASAYADAPDIYYIILDMYGRQDVLRDHFDFDNSNFVDALREMGFTVADCSIANYPHTFASLASSLNYRYLDDIPEKDLLPDIEKGWLESTLSQPLLAKKITNSEVARNLHAAGYQVVAVESLTPWLNMYNADRLYSFSGHAYLTDFETFLIYTTVLQPIWDVLPVNSFEIEKDKRLMGIHALSQISTERSPKFVFVHVPVPHWPFLFNADGSENTGYHADPAKPENRDNPGYREAYSQQAAFISSQILPALQEIIEKSETPPVIILQGDHGPDGLADDRMPILNAIYFPGGTPAAWYPQISPVNTFRLVFDQYLGANLDLLPDVSYYYSDEQHSGLAPVQDPSAACQIKSAK